MTTLTFDAALTEVSAIAHAKLPEALHGRLEMATALVRADAVWLEEDGHTVQVRSTEDPTRWYPVNGVCPCPDAAHRAPDGWCKHKLGAALRKRTVERLDEEEERYDVVALSPEPVAPTIPAEGLTMIQGKPFVRFEALLQMAHAQGLLRLETTVVSVSEVLCVCQATATFKDGRIFTDIGDATERNVPKHLSPHFIRLSATRASARALRRALNLSECSVEELSGQEDTQ
jgi:hypothetical protein